MSVYRFQKNKTWNSFLGKIKNQLIFYRFLSVILVFVILLLLFIYFANQNKQSYQSSEFTKSFSQKINSLGNLKKYEIKKDYSFPLQINIKNFNNKKEKNITQTYLFTKDFYPFDIKNIFKKNTEFTFFKIEIKSYLPISKNIWFIRWIEKDIISYDLKEVFEFSTIVNVEPVLKSKELTLYYPIKSYLKNLFFAPL